MKRLAHISVKANPRSMRIKPLCGDRNQNTDKVEALRADAGRTLETQVA
ncbi:MAG TPA: hypothetical protein VIW72_05150 [Burkholderiales bacterium]